MTDISDSFEEFQRNRKSWSQHEDTSLIKLVKRYGTKRWTDISKAMSDLFEINNKSGKQCRQRWVNHLDPKINKEKWTTQEERKILDLHKIHGNKWKVIAKQLDGRTDNSIKNHFYSILRKGLRRLNKLLGDRKSTEKVKEIRTSVLSKLCKIQSSSDKIQEAINIPEIYELLFQFSSMNSTNISQKNLTLSLKNDFKTLISNLQQISSEQKINKEKNVTQNKLRKTKKNSYSRQMNEQNQEQSKFLNSLQQNDKQEEKVLVTNQNIAQVQEPMIVSTGRTQSKFMINIEIRKESIKQKDEKQQSLKSMQEQRRSQKQSVSSFVLNHSENNYKSVGTEKEQELQEQNFILPIIQIDEKSLSIALSNELTFNNCFNRSPDYPSSRLNFRTPRIPSPGAFNFCGNYSTAQSYGNGGSLIMLNRNEGSSQSFDSQLNSMVQQLRSQIAKNQNQPATQIRVNSSRNTLIEPCLKNSSSSIFLTPRSGQGKAH